ncbi:hypothetical protein [Microvirga sp. VF16]|uniref:hypothetical protein n=1 Tax=Microvirga sp. VF16 TaxID=2807101 RepID=UPI00193C9BE8|nr:hypothetical protein [Microvirga sp. VF16]QRM27264.1 hypothetical protein JO965_13180 [Microvirga sp. VF16]
MSVKVVPYENTHIPAVHAFNERIRAGGINFRFPEDKVSEQTEEDPQIFKRECYLALERDGTMRGGYVLKRHPYQRCGKDAIAGNYQLPLSEGTINPAYGMVGIQILLDCLARQPRLYCLGMGGLERPLPVMLRKMGWRVDLVPFFFHIVHPQAFLKGIVFLRQYPKYRAALDLLRLTGVGYISLKAWMSLSAIVCSVRIAARRTSSSKALEFGEWADTIFRKASPIYEFIGVRDRAALAQLYPVSDSRFIRVLVENKQGPVGWAVVLATQMQGHKQFGDMKVGSLVDVLTIPGYEGDVVDHAIRTLKRHNVDLIVSNQSSSEWQRALRGAGFIQGPSNFAIACSKQLASEITDFGSCHFNRGDGDGPIHL